MTYQEIIDELKKQNIKTNEFAWGDIENPLPNIGDWKEVYQQGGEGEGDHWESVKYFKDHDVYIQICGRWSSYEGTDFDDDLVRCCYNVRPQEKTITVYE